MFVSPGVPVGRHLEKLGTNAFRHEEASDRLRPSHSSETDDLRDYALG